MAAHSKIGASSYYRWKACPGSVKQSEGIPNKSSKYAAQGTVAHDLAADMLDDHFFGKGKPKIPANYPAEDMEAIKVYVELIRKDANMYGSLASKGHVLIEHRFDLSEVHPGLFGTGDAVLYSPIEKKLSVYDYKHGAGIPVQVENNLQAQYYGLGALLSTGFPVEKVELIIVQPRCDHPDGVIRKWEFNAINLIDFAADLALDAKKTEDPNAEIKEGKHCQFCPAAATNCPLLRDKSRAMAKIEFSPTSVYEPKQLQESLDFLPTLEGWIKQVREFAFDEASHGRKVPGYKLVAKRATRKWAAEEEMIEDVLLGTELSPDDLYKTSLLSPAQIEKKLSKKERSVIDSLVKKESSGHTLVHEMDKRPAVKLDASADFKKVE